MDRLGSKVRVGVCERVFAYQQSLSPLVALYINRSFHHCVLIEGIASDFYRLSTGSWVEVCLSDGYYVLHLRFERAVSSFFCENWERHIRVIFLLHFRYVLWNRAAWEFKREVL